MTREYLDMHVTEARVNTQAMENIAHLRLAWSVSKGQC